MPHTGALLPPLTCTLTDPHQAREMIKKLDPNHVTEEQLRAVWGSGGGKQQKARKPQKQ